ncbi:MAG: CvpA family protein [Clostridia bacterium]
MAIIDIVAISIILIFGIIGLIRGLANTLFRLVGFLIVIIISYMLCNQCGAILEQAFGKQANEEAKAWIIKLDEGVDESEKLFTVPIDWTKSENVSKALKKVGMPDILASVSSGFVSNVFRDFGTEGVLSEKLPPKATHWAMIGLAFLALMLILSIIMAVIKHLITGLIKKLSFIRTVDRIGGLALGIAFGVVIYSAIYFVLVYVPIPFLSGLREMISQQVKESAETTKIAYLLSDSFITRFLISMFTKS